MALQGTLDTFELPDVLRLLASTKKTGRLQLQGDRGDGAVWLQDGEVVAVEALGAPGGDVAEGMFDLLRAREGGFAFEPGVVADSPAPAAPVEPLLAATETRLAEWREIESVVPSLHAWVSLNPELPGGEITVDAATWRLVATIGSGMTVGDLAVALDLAEVPVSRLVRDLVVLGVGSVVDAQPLTVAAPAPEPLATWEPAVAPEPAPAEVNGDASYFDAAPVDHGADLAPADFDAEARAPIFSAPAEEPVFDASAPWDRDDVPAASSFVEEAPAYEPVAYEPVAYEPAADGVDDDADEVARQLAMLSPRAAQAVAAAAAADSDSERDAHLEALDDGDEPINRGLLLKFLSSVKS